MTKETAEGRCPKCGAARYKMHTFEHDIAVCRKCGDRENIDYGGR